jgi:transcriptional regulator with XRE-family HTH domain
VILKAKLRIREVRKATGLSQKALSELAGVREATLSVYERNLVDSVNLEIIAKLAEALDVDVDELFEPGDPKVEAAA